MKPKLINHHSDCTVPTMKQGGGGELTWGCMRGKGVGEMTFIDGATNAGLFTQILLEKTCPSLKKLGRRGIFQHDNDPKHKRVCKEEKCGNDKPGEICPLT
uniref:Tc1-like transposase DDE domain-containing protein n=1 Tax=Seriola dumerili TaxID=41447 RepID=A0A3B4U884_SERDU